MILTPLAGELALAVSPLDSRKVRPELATTELSTPDVAWLLFDQAFEPAFTWTQGEERTITAWNTAAERLYGIPRAAALGRDPRALLKSHCDGTMSVVDVALARDGQWRGELVQSNVHGHELIVETVMKLLVLPDGRQIVLEASRDVSLERKAEREAREAQMRLRLALSANQTGIWERDLITGEAYWSPEAYTAIGVDPETFQVTVEAFGALMHPEDGPRVWAEVERVMNGASGFDCYFRVCLPSGEQRWLHNCAIAVRDDAGVARRLVGTVRDITHERTLIAKVAESEAKHRELANAVPQIVWTCRPDGSIDWLNEQWFEYTGMHESATDDEINKLIHPDDLTIVARWYEAVANGRTWEAEYRLRSADGSFQWHLGRMVPIRDADGNIVRLIATATNIQERKQAEEALRESDRRKDQFLAMLSHELRNPLAPIVTALQLMSLRGYEQGREERSIIERHAQHMVRLVDDLLDVSKLAQGKVELRKQTIGVASFVAKAIEATAPLIEKMRHELHVDVPADLMVHGDEVRLVQVVSNLLTNAARYTPQAGRISVLARAEGAEVVLQVLDNGCGISAELLPRVFEMFVQGPRTFDRSEGGLGLGLALVASLTELHGGKVFAHSAGAGLGSELIVRLPQVARNHSADSLTSAVKRVVPAATCNVLLVDDNEDAVELLASALRARGHRVCVAFDPVHALSMLEEFQPDLAILDIGLPVMDGYQLAGELRKRLATPTVLYALSGYAQEADLQKSRDAGFQRHFVKPVDTGVLLDEASRVAATLNGGARAQE